MDNYGLLLFFLFLIFCLPIGYLAWRRKKFPFKYVLIMFGGPFGVYIAIVLVVNTLHSKTLAPFQPYLNEYIYLPGEEAGDPVQQIFRANPTDNPYLHGKVVPVKLGGDGELDEFYFWLPKTLRAASPDEVGSVIWLYCTGHPETVSVTDSRGVTVVWVSVDAATIWNCDVAVIDRSSQAMIAKQSFKETSDSGYQDALYKDIVEYIIGLPRK